MKNVDIMINYQKLQNVLPTLKALPAKVSFAIIRNNRALENVARDIEQIKYSLASSYGERNPKNPEEYIIPEQSINIVQNELNSLGETDTDIYLIKISLNDIKDLDFTLEQMDALMFMIED